MKFIRLLLSLVFLIPIEGMAFYQSTDDGPLIIDARGLFQGVGLVLDNPDDSILFPKKGERVGNASLRLLLDLDTPGWHFETHLIQAYQTNFLNNQQRIVSEATERSGVFTKRYADDKASLVLDRFNVQTGSGPINFKIGRQPVNFSVTSYFAPNDFFSPFAAQTFYRTYKSGVDAARINWQWNDLSELTFLTVLNYQLSNHDGSEWRSQPDWSNTAYLLRAATLLGDAQLALFAAELDNTSIFGFDYQGELFGWLSLRSEGHTRFVEGDDQTQLALSFEYQTTSVTNYRLELFYQSESGVESDNSLDLYEQSFLGALYLGHFYTAVGADYELTPLLNTSLVILHNHSDDSSLFAVYSRYSLSDESELAVGINLPFGASPNNGKWRSEYGSYPSTLSVELRTYF